MENSKLITILAQVDEGTKTPFKAHNEILSLFGVVVAERTLNCNHEWINNPHRKTKYCRKGCAGFDEIGI